MLTYRGRFPTVSFLRTGRLGYLFLSEVEMSVNAFDLNPFPLRYVAGLASSSSRAWLVSASVRDQCDAEISLGQFSPVFGPDLLPGMYSEPIQAVPKPQSEKLRLVGSGPD
ncbi:hypothetical protein B0H14DRAFT_2752076 [Mycena olivaceomarginata]|nr:hypothetical protein B0H14DRAFT_2752076 [Mycena olivaceomarginata]